jgi:hypothetical protein
VLSKEIKINHRIFHRELGEMAAIKDGSNTQVGLPSITAAVDN